MKKLLAITDSPKVTTGFSTVAKEFYKAFKDEFNLTVIGALDMDFDYLGELPYRFFPSAPIDALGLTAAIDAIKRVKPDIVWVMFDPGNVFRFATELANLRQTEGLNFTIVAYIPIEGFPIPGIHKDCIDFLVEHGDKVIFWNEGANKVAGTSFPVVNFGIDHAPWRRYELEDRKRLRLLTGLDDYFVVGSVGVNKRTKGYPALIYTAQKLKDLGYGNKIKFYCHTEPDNPTMQGFHLRQLAATYGVSEMFLWKPDSNSTRGNMWKGIDRFGNTIEETRGLEVPKEAKDRRDLFARYDFISRLNCLDLYFDTSQVEGWGLPLCFHPETYITTIDGQKSIKDIQIGDLVVSHTGNWKTVRNKMSRIASCRKISTRYGHSVIITDEHPILAIKRNNKPFSTLKQFKTDLEWIPAFQLVKDDIVVTPKPKVPNNTNHIIDLRDYSDKYIEKDGKITSPYSNCGVKCEVSLQCVANELGISTEIVSRVSRGSEESVGSETRKRIEYELKSKGYVNQKLWIPATIEVDEDISELLGWYTAEGSSYKGIIEFSLHAQETEDSDRISSIIYNRFGLSTTRIIDGNRMKLRVNSSILGKFFIHLCGKGAKNKKIPDCILFSNKNNIISFLKGYTRGDGHVGREAVSITTASEKLADQIKFILLQLNILSRKDESDGIFTITSSGIAAREWASISQELECMEHLDRTGQGYYEDDNYFYYPITEVITNIYNGPVYNIEVDRDNSYLANYITVHNCEAMACGIPTCIPNDHYVRHELFSEGAYEYPSIPIDLWDTWHTGVRLVQTDPSIAASTIIEFYNSPELCKTVGQRGMDFIKQYSWDKAREEMVCLLKDL